MDTVMQHRPLGRTGRTVSVVGLGTWQLGADWGDVSESDARAVLEAAAEEGVTFFDTADVYGDGRSEQIIGGFLADHPDAGITVATKMGRRVEQVPENYMLANFRAWTDRSRRNLGVDRLDLVQLHCPPTPVYRRRRGLRRAGHPRRRGRHRGVRRERRDAPTRRSTAIAPTRHVATVQIILNAFRLKPLDEVLPAAAAAGVGIIARVPLASGLLLGQVRRATRPSPPTTTATTTATAAPSTSARPSPAWTSRPGLEAARSSPRSSRRGARRRHSGPGGHRLDRRSSPASAPSSPARATSTQARANAAAGSAAAARRRRSTTASATIYDRAPPGGDPPALVTTTRAAVSGRFGLGRHGGQRADRAAAGDAAA